MAKKQKLGPNQEKWLKALESGKYEQGKGFLVSFSDSKKDKKPKHCCLGVACELFYKKLGLVKETQDLDVNNTKIHVSFNGEKYVLPESVMDLLKIKTPNATAVKDSTGSLGVVLTDLNDKGVPFAKIAEKIRKNPEWFFTEPA